MKCSIVACWWGGGSDDARVYDLEILIEGWFRNFFAGVVSFAARLLFRKRLRAKRLGAIPSG